VKKTPETFSDLLPYCQTDRQRELIGACAKSGSARAAAKAIGASKSSVQEAVNRVKEYAARKGWAPDHAMGHPVAPGFEVSGTSTLRNQDGEVVMQWQKTRQDDEARLEAMQAAVRAMADDIMPVMPEPSVIHKTDNDLLSCYVLTDYHMGMLSWGDETGEDWDLRKSESVLYRWIEKAVALSPNSDKAVLAQLGDLLHWDGLDAVTPTSRNLLDADTRFPKLVEASVRVMRRLVQRLLSKHRTVHLIMAEGNHDMASSVWLREMFAQLYANEPRVTVEKSPRPYYCVEHGQTSLFFHHGHLRKPGECAEVFASIFRDVMGRTKHSYAHLGHKHHKQAIETPLMVVEQHQTLAAKDAHASRHGYMSDRSAQVINYHREAGEIGRVRIPVCLIEKCEEGAA